MMSKKMGRPTISEDGAKQIIKTQRYGEDDSKLTSKAAQSAGQGESTFIRSAAIEKAKRNPWGKCRFSKEELQGHYLKFKLHSERGVTSGIGRIEARANPKGLIAVDIFVDQMENGRLTSYRIWIDSEGVKRIESNPDKSPAKFRLWA
jgi:hypothetical protein